METVMHSEEATEALLKRAQKGERAALDEIAKCYEQRLRSLVLARLDAPLRTMVEAEDVVQETFVRAFRSIEKVHWQGEASFFGWLSGIAINVIREFANLNKRRPAGVACQEGPTDDPTPSKNMRREERFNRLQDALSVLSDDHRQVILMARIDKLPIKEIARKLDRSTAAVSQLLLRALDRLKEEFGDTESLHLPQRSLREKGGEDV